MIISFRRFVSGGPIDTARRMYRPLALHLLHQDQLVCFSQWMCGMKEPLSESQVRRCHLSRRRQPRGRRCQHRIMRRQSEPHIRRRQHRHRRRCKTTSRPRRRQPHNRRRQHRIRRRQPRMRRRQPRLRRRQHRHRRRCKATSRLRRCQPHTRLRQHQH